MQHKEYNTNASGCSITRHACTVFYLIFNGQYKNFCVVLSLITKLQKIKIIKLL